MYIYMYMYSTNFRNALRKSLMYVCMYNMWILILQIYLRQ